MRMQYVQYALFPILLIGAVHRNDTPSTNEDKVAADMRAVATTSEIHGVGIYEPAECRFRSTDVNDWPKLIQLLRAQQGPIKHVWDLLEADTQKLILDDNNYRAFTNDSSTIEVYRAKARISLDILTIIQGNKLYKQEVFVRLKFSPELQSIIDIGDKRTRYQTLKMNRHLLAAIFPKVIADISQSYQIARVKIVAGKNIILVLSSYESCRWEIDLERNAVLSGVILCGYHDQEISLNNIPILYRARHTPEGIARKGEAYHGYDETNRTFKQFAAGIKDILGKEFTSFQGQYLAGNTPFIVPYKSIKVP